jgi:cell surface protein SprA
LKFRILKTYRSLLFFVLFFTALIIQAQTPPKPPVPAKIDTLKIPPVKKIDTTKIDTVKNLPYSFKSYQQGSLFLNELRNVEVIYDPVKGQYIFVEKVGDYFIKHPFYMTKKEYEEYRLRRDMLDYFKEKVSAVGGRKKNAAEAQKNLLPKYYVKSEFFENLFGGNSIEVNPQGSVLVRMGMLFQKVENPQLSERNRSSKVFAYQQEINASLNAQIGKRLKVNAAFDTQSTFNFQNQIKLEYTPTEDDIIRKIEVGNVSMPIQSSLISGAQNLFGVKTQLQFGKTTVTGVFSQQRSQTRSVQAQGGSTIQEFDIRASDYDDNRHFFLSQKFRDNYNDALKNLPLVASTKYVTRVEVWITNRNSTTENVRNIVALADLGEGESTNLGSSAIIVNGSQDPSNQTNSLSNFLTAGNQIRDIATVTNALVGFSQGSDYSILENARKLTLGIDFELNPQLGYITLNRRLADSDILAVAFEYTESNPNLSNPGENVFRVGELSGDGVTAPDNLVVKLLRSEIIDTDLPIWDLMMKNVYSLQGAFQLNQDGFRLEVLYQDDETGVPINFLQNAKTIIDSDSVSKQPLLNLLRLDILDGTNNQLDGGDGYFDFVEGITINSQNGYIMFPTVEPFGSSGSATIDLLETGELGQILTNPLDEKFIFKELYDQTKAQAQNNFQSKDKYSLKGYFKSESSGGIRLNAFNVSRGSVTVTSGGRELTEGVDYVVDYQIGTVQIINPNLIASNAPIDVSVENNNGFNQQQRTFMGVDVQHIFSDKFAVGGTVVNLNERPFTQKPQFGAEPVNNTIVGFNLNYNTEVPKFTKWVNKLPNIDTDVPSNFSIRAEAAYLLPGSPKGIDLNGEAASYIDDFEGSQIPLDISSPRQWFLASVPNGDDENILPVALDFTNAPVAPGLDAGLSLIAERSRLAWYTIDRLFYGSTLKPTNIDDTELSRAEVRRVGFEELFPELDLDVTQANIVNTLDLAYYPKERGSYNFNAGLINDTYGTIPEDKWGGIMRSLNTTDFQQANVEYIQFWLMNPYENYSMTPEEGAPAVITPADLGGEVYFNLGNVSEDILPDNRRMYENGLPPDGIKIPGSNIDTTPLGVDVPINQSLIYAFSEEDDERPNQDIGLDGLTDQEEIQRFGTAFGSDPANDNYTFFRGGDLDDARASILTRYRNFNNTQGNSPTINNSNESFPTSGTSFPDIEDINRDQTMSAVEGYFQYKISLNPADLIVGQNNIVDEKIVPVNLPDGTQQTTTWYQFRIPITTDNPIGNITDLNSVRFMRIFLTQFKIPVVLRFGELELIRGDWRRYTQSLAEPLPADPELDEDENRNFEVGVVNIQENETKAPIPYVLPPGVVRERLQGSTTIQQQNEQSLLVRIKELEPGETRAVFKNTTYDMRMFNKLKMFVHAENITGLPDTDNNDLTAIIRLGSDTNDNFYQLEIPLKITESGEFSADSVWKNDFNTELKELGKLKLEKFTSGAPNNEIYPSITADPEARIRVKGSPNLSNIRTLMIGIRNDATSNKTAELWFNELRVVDFDNKGGWAAVLNADANFADFADVSIAATASSSGFGALEQRVSERSQEDVKQYDIVTNVNLGQLLPKNTGIKIPLNYSFSEEIRDPKWDPQYQDVLFEDAKDINPNSKNSRNYTKRRSINLINVRKERTNTEKKKHFYDIENVSASYSFNETNHKDYNIVRFIDQNVRASATYNYSFKPFSLEPLKNWKFLNKGSYLKFIKDFNINLLPSSIAVNSNIIRSYNQQESRSLVVELPTLPVLTQRRFLFDWDYNIAYDLTKSLQFTFGAANNFIIDEFNQEEGSEDVTIFDNFFQVGRPNNYHQTLDANYKIPLNKIPIFDFINATYKYTADFDWQAPSNSFTNAIGNIVQNANTHTLSADLDMRKFYKRTGILDLAKPKKKKIKKKKKKKNTKNKKDSTKVKPTIAIAKPRTVRTNSKKMTGGQKIVQGLVDVVTSVKKIRVGYSENNGTVLPGYIPEIGFLGRDRFRGGTAPTLGFVFGSQQDIRQLALANDWLNLNDEFSQIYSTRNLTKLDISAEVKPAKNLNIELSANRIFASNISQQLARNSSNELDENFPTNEVGNFSISTFMLKNAFDGDGDATFEKFKSNRTIIAQRLANETNQSISGFGLNSTQVLLPAFLATYTGQDPEKVKTSPFRDIPIPNWRVNYKGLMQFPWFKKHFRSFTLEHKYNSTYSIIGFSNNLLYDNSDPFSETDLNGNYQSSKLFTGINLVEEFSPLIKVDMKMRNSFSLRAEIRKDKALNLNFNNNTLTEIRGIEYIVGLGYRFKDVRLKMKTGNTTTTFKGDINLKADLGIRNNSTIIRSINIDNNQITGGQKLVSIKFIADYALSRSLLASFFYDQNSSQFLISTTFPRKSVNAGISIRYTIGN